MKKPLAIMLLGAALVWGCTMGVKYARADDVVGPVPKWKITLQVHDPDQGDVGLVYGNQQTGPVYFASEKECLAAIKADKKFLEILKKVLDFAKQRKASVEPPQCMLDVKPNEI